ncbi:MAG TPA: crotonase/enoyl-CoA hydratase family protein [Candidatus Acidoferrales bacterium]|nr:crotonase/enoyl-CoA hydratase family protein [Candidatus Acidoferrales bacterium]
MSYRCFNVTIEDKIAHIVLNRPEKRNSMIAEFWDELPQIIGDIDDNARARAIVISSTGPHFTSGLDVSAFAAGGGNPVADQNEADQRRARRHRGAGFYSNVTRMQRSFSSLENCRVPVLAAIQGGCIGGGVDLVTACDMRYATEDAFLTIFEINIGLTADVGTFPRLVKLIPEGVVRELAYTGRRMPAREAQAIGLVNRVFADQKQMLEGVTAIAREIASKAPLAVYGCKRMINYARDHSTADGLDYVGIWNASMLQPDEVLEAMTSNAQKRAGDFVDLPVFKRTM